MTTTSLGPSVLEHVISGGQLSRSEARVLLLSLVDAEILPETAAGILVALRMRGETSDEALGFRDGLMERALLLETAPRVLLDTCGTGGDRSGTFNISTAVALTVASCGVAVAKHGNRSVSSRSGSTDVLEAAGVPMQGVPLSVLERALGELGIVLMHAPNHHPVLATLGPVRRALGVMTLFNLMGPLINPAPLTHQMMGVPRKSALDLLAPVCEARGIPTLLLHSSSGADEALPGYPFHVKHVRPGEPTHTETCDPEQYGVHTIDMHELDGGSPEENAARLIQLLDGQGAHGLAETVALNAGLALHHTGTSSSVEGGVEMARRALRQGAPGNLLRAYRQLIQGAMA
jgi:anthranilate phosphoribosyltransferase